MSRVVSFSLYGSNPAYTVNAVINCLLAPEVYPGWTCRFYHDDTVPEGVLGLLATFEHAELVPMPAGRGGSGRLWRFLAAADPTVEAMVCRDADSWLSPREAACVDEWLASGRPFHIIRDHCLHSAPIMAGMWGARGGVLGAIGTWIEDFLRTDDPGQAGADQRFLAVRVRPHVAGQALIHQGTQVPSPDGVVDDLADRTEPIPPYDDVDEPVPGLSFREAFALNSDVCFRCGAAHAAFIGPHLNTIPVRARELVRERARSCDIPVDAIPGLQPRAAPPPVVCIAPPTGHEERRRMERRFSHHGLLDRTTFIEALRTDSPLVDERPAGLPQEEVDAGTRAAAARLANHLRALRALLEDTDVSAAGGIVCEDRLLLHNECAAHLGAVVANLPAGAPLCSLSYARSSWDGAAWAGRRPEEHNLCTFVAAQLITGSAMYWISRRYAETVLERWDVPFRHLPPGLSSDVIVRWSGGYLSYPPLALPKADDDEPGLSAAAAWGSHNFSTSEQDKEPGSEGHRWRPAVPPWAGR